jgi:acetyl-CoA synthetase
MSPYLLVLTVVLEKELLMRNLHQRYIEEAYNEEGLLTEFALNVPESFNFAYDVVDDIAVNDPYRRAMVWCNPEGEEHVFTFADMKYWSDKTAQVFAEEGIGRGDFVMVILRRHYQFWFVMLALQKLGAVAVPATFMLKEHDLDYRLNGATIKAIVCTSAGEIATTVENVLPECKSVQSLFLVNPAGGGLTPQNEAGEWLIAEGELAGPVLSGPTGICAAPIQREGWIDFNTAVRNASPYFERHETKAHEPMLMYFSSGTSGNPKMVLHDSGYALAHIMTAKHWQNAEPDGLHFTIADTGWGKAVWGKFFGQWLMEAAVLTYDFDRFHAADILSLVERYEVTSLCCPPTMYRLLTEVDIDSYDLSGLHYCTTAGEALNPDLFNFWKEHTGLTIFEGFGQTETPLTVGNLTHSVPRSGSMGKPVPLYDMRILREDDTECDLGETGEICISIDPHPAGIMMEYYRDPVKTAEAMRDGWYHTGDTAWCDEEGNYWYVGRNDDVIKSSGYRIGPFEIESVLLEHDAVRECAVTAVPDPVRGFAVKATIVLAEGFRPGEDLTRDLQRWVKNQTAPYKYPRIVEYVSELPRTVNGKIRRAAIREQDATCKEPEVTAEGLI